MLEMRRKGEEKNLQAMSTWPLRTRGWGIVRRISFPGKRALWRSQIVGEYVLHYISLKQRIKGEDCDILELTGVVDPDPPGRYIPSHDLS